MARKDSARGDLAATPALIAARRAGVDFTVHRFEADLDDDRGYGLAAAQELGVDPRRVFKTLVAELDGKLVVGIVPVGRQLDLKALAKAAGGKAAAMADPAQAERATGYVVGGISPVGQKRRLPAFVDETALAFETVLVSAGRRGWDIELRPTDLLSLTGASVGSIAR